MKSLNGLLFIVAGGLVIWIGATGRLPALAAALGMIRQAPGTAGGTAQPSQAVSSTPQVNFGDVKAGSSSTASPTPTQGMYDLGFNAYRNVLGIQ